ncbi:MAG: DUF4339 domain-containing protein [Myxococcales bacterium]|nr:DUF4339 domain-containing protein [Myxococcales bacterium]MCB9578513.1 DUF4339 domain-containing protein [Polyangiaceae bacterium]
MAEDVNEFWFWATNDGALKTVDRKELVSSLSRGDIPAKAFVWRQGWAEWIRAAQVSELSGALSPAARQSPVMPKMSPDATHPPPVPRADNIALEPIVPVQSTPENDKPQTQLLVEDELSVTDLEPVEPPASKAPPPPRRPPSSRPAPPRPAGSSLTAAPRPAGSSLTGAPVVPVGSAPSNGAAKSAPKLEDSAPPSANWVEVSPTAPKITEKVEEKKLEPIVPVDSSPRNDPPTGELDAAEIEFVDEPEKKSTSLADLEAAVAKKKPQPIPRPAPVLAVNAAPEAELPTQKENPLVPEMQDAIIPVSEPDNDAPTTVQASPLNEERAPAEPLPSWSAEVDAEIAADAVPQVYAPSAPPPAVAPSYAPPPKKSSMGLVLGGLGVVAVLGIGVIGAGLFYFKPWESGSTDAKTAKAPASAAPTTEAPAAEPASTAACTISKAATRIAPSVMVSVPLYVDAAGGTSLAVGFASSATSATGITLDPSTLDHQEVFSRAGSNNVVGVVPSHKGGELGFAVDRDGDSLKVGHTVDADKPFVIGMGPNGYSSMPVGGSATTVWPGGMDQKMTEARVVSVKDVGHAVAFRRGGRDGEVYVGWLAPDGSKKTDLGTVEAEGPRVGTPTVAANEESLLVTFAARATDDAPWGVRIATAKLGELPKASQKMALPSGGPGGEAISPVAVGLPGKRWLIQWTEGPSGQRTVRAQTFSNDLKPLGEPMTLSPSGQEAGQGAVGFSGDHASAFYLVKGGQGYELWATSLSCK